MKKISLMLVVCILLSVMLSGCGYEYKEYELRGTYSRDLAGTTLTVYNWGEYISDGDDDSIDVNKEFEKLTGIKVTYLTFESNETMYSQVMNAGVSYDIVIPSEYMVERLINNGMLAEIDASKLSNYDLIDPRYQGLFYDPDNKYCIPYCVGMVGIIYNSALIDEPKHSWNALWSEKYRGMSLNFNNPRDAFMTAQILLGLDVNSTNTDDWQAAADLLIKGKDVLQDYVMDEIYGKLETGEAAIGPYYAGDYLTMYDTNEDLRFFYPEEGTNTFVDSMCILKDTDNYEAALMYINFMLEPEIATANAEYIGYASPNIAVINNEDYCYYQNEILYPSDEDMPKVVFYHDIDKETRIFYETLWVDVRRS